MKKGLENIKNINNYIYIFATVLTVLLVMRFIKDPFGIKKKKKEKEKKETKKFNVLQQSTNPIIVKYKDGINNLLKYYKNKGIKPSITEEEASKIARKIYENLDDWVVTDKKIDPLYEIKNEADFLLVEKYFLIRYSGGKRYTLITYMLDNLKRKTIADLVNYWNNNGFDFKKFYELRKQELAKQMKK